MKYGIRKAVATIIVGAVIQLLNLGGVGLALVRNISVRSALFLLLILMALYVAIVTFFWLSIEGVGKHNNPFYMESEEDETENGYIEDVHHRSNVSPLPERNHGSINRTNHYSERRNPPPLPVKR